MENSTLREAVEASPLFNGLPMEQIDHVVRIVVKKQYGRGETIFFEGDEGKGFYMVESGKVKIYKMSLSGKEQILHIFGPGEPFGEVGAGPKPLRYQATEDGKFIAYAVADWCRFNDVGTCFIDPGSPWQNAWIESFNGRLRDEFLNGWQFDSLREAQVLIEDWRIDYNNNRPHSAFGLLTPTEFANQWATINQPQLA